MQRIIDYFNKEILKNIKKKSIIFGQNITTGSKISGMTNFLDKLKNSEILNTQNSENSLIGFGFGICLSGKNAIYLVKQLDFILLGIDHIVNTLNSIYLENKSGSFSIITYVVDSGFEGPQSRFHCLQEISQLSKANCIYLIFPDDIKYNIKNINKNKFNIFCLSQKNSRLNLNPKCINSFEKGKIFKYSDGNLATIVSNGFSSYYVYDKIIKKNINKYDFYTLTNPDIDNLSELVKSIKKTKKLIMFDDSKSKNKNTLNKLELVIKNLNKKIIIKKYYKNDAIEYLYANEDIYKPSIGKI